MEEKDKKDENVSKLFPRINPETIRPKVKGKADFFSWNLYKYVKQHPLDKVWMGTWNSIDGIQSEPNTLYIGYMEDGRCWFHGNMLRRVCCFPKERWAMNRGHDLVNWKECTDDFMADYLRRGVCAIHNGMAHKWTESGGKRTCEYCGLTEKAMVKILTKQIWVAA